MMIHPSPKILKFLVSITHAPQQQHGYQRIGASRSLLLLVSVEDYSISVLPQIPGNVDELHY
jgi:hypothetical protein